jgi:hypothetical protein
MKSIWASGAIELLNHADSHMEENTAFDKRIAFISIDNCVETMIRTFLSLPKTKSGIHVKKHEIDDAGTSFTNLLALLYKHASDRLIGIDPGDIEHYHRIRNHLYHEGTGLSVDEQYLRAYRSFAGLLLKNLFNVTVEPTSKGNNSLEKLILNWNQIEQYISNRLEDRGIAITHRWEQSYVKGLFDQNTWNNINNLRQARNKLVHSKEIDRKDLFTWIRVSEEILKRLREYKKE